MKPETSFNDFFADLHSQKTQISWYKNTPVTAAERKAARMVKLGIVVGVVLMIALFVGMVYLDPQLFASIKGLFFQDGKIDLLFAGMAAIPLLLMIVADVWLIRRANRVIHAAEGVPMAAQYFCIFKGSAKGLSVAHGIACRLDWENFSEREWQMILPSMSDAQLSEAVALIKQKLL
ncbi:MAG: hypothetical protein Q4G42_00735 [Neisseria sp.]|nr:hypothetical protein [Neisseria sp.]